MVPAEIQLWRTFQRANQHLFTAVHFNVHVGVVAGDDVAEADADRLLRATIYAKRIDVVARLATETWVIEVKERATPRALGQLLVYVPTLLRRFPDFPRPRPILVATAIDPDAVDACRTLGITCVTPPFQPLALLS